MNLHGQKYKIKHTQIPRYFLRWMPKITPEEFWVIVALYQIKFFQGPINDLGKSQFNIRSLPIPTKTPSIRMISRWSGLSERKVADIVSQSTICHGLIQKNRHKNGKGKTMSNSFSIHLGLTAQDAWTTYLWFEKELEKDGAEFHLVMEDYIHNPSKPIKALQLELWPEPEKVKPVHEFVDLLCDTFGKYYRYTPEERKEFTQMIELNLFGHQLSISHNFIEIVKEQRSRFANILLLLRSRTYINYGTGEVRENVEFKQGYQEISMLTGIPKNTIKNALTKENSFFVMFIDGHKRSFALNFASIDGYEEIEPNKNLDLIAEEPTLDLEKELNTIFEEELSTSKQTVPAYPKVIQIKGAEHDEVILPTTQTQNELSTTKQTDDAQLKKQALNLKNIKPKNKQVNHRSNLIKPPQTSSGESCLLPEKEKIYNHYFWHTTHKELATYEFDHVIAYLIYLSTKAGENLGSGWVLNELRKGSYFLDTGDGKICLELAKNPLQYFSALLQIEDDEDPFAFLYHESELESFSLERNQQKMLDLSKHYTSCFPQLQH